MAISATRRSRPITEGIELLNRIQDVHLDGAVTIALYDCSVSTRKDNRQAAKKTQKELVGIRSVTGMKEHTFDSVVMFGDSLHHDSVICGTI